MEDLNRLLKQDGDDGIEVKFLDPDLLHDFSSKPDPGKLLMDEMKDIDARIRHLDAHGEEASPEEMAAMMETAAEFAAQMLRERGYESLELYARALLSFHWLQVLRHAISEPEMVELVRRHRGKLAEVSRQSEQQILVQLKQAMQQMLEHMASPPQGEEGDERP